MGIIARGDYSKAGILILEASLTQSRLGVKLRDMGDTEGLKPSNSSYKIEDRVLIQSVALSDWVWALSIATVAWLVLLHVTSDPTLILLVPGTPALLLLYRVFLRPRELDRFTRWVGGACLYALFALLCFWSIPPLFDRFGTALFLVLGFYFYAPIILLVGIALVFWPRLLPRKLIETPWWGIGIVLTLFGFRFGGMWLDSDARVKRLFVQHRAALEALVQMTLEDFPAGADGIVFDGLAGQQGGQSVPRVSTVKRSEQYERLCARAGILRISTYNRQVFLDARMQGWALAESNRGFAWSTERPKERRGDAYETYEPMDGYWYFYFHSHY